MSERPYSPPDLQESPPRLCQCQEAPAVLWSVVASLQSSWWVPHIRLHILSSLHVSLGPNLPIYKRTPVFWTPTCPNGLTNSITSAKSSSPGQATSTGTGVRISTHLAGDEREPIPGPGRDLTAPEGHTAVSVGAGLIAPGSNAALFRGLSRLYVQEPASWNQRGWYQPAKPSQSLQSASAASGSCRLPCPGYSVGPSTAAELSLPPSTPILLRVELRVPTRERRLGRGEGGAVSESQAPTRVTCPLRSSGFSLQVSPHQDAPGFLQEGIKRGEGFPIEHGNY